MSAWAGCNAGYLIGYLQKGIFLKNLKFLHNLFFGNIALEKRFVEVQGSIEDKPFYIDFSKGLRFFLWFVFGKVSLETMFGYKTSIFKL